MYVEADNPSKDILKKLMQSFGSGELLNVVDQTQKLLVDYSQSTFLWNLQGAAYLGLDKFKEAEMSFSKIIDLNSNLAEGYSNYGLALQKQKKFSEAIEALKKALEINPELAEGHNNLGHIYRVNKNYLEAIQSYENALKANPNLTEALVFKFQQQSQICDWSYLLQYKEKSKTFGVNGEAIEPFSLISKEDNPELQLRCARNCSKTKYKRNKLDEFKGPFSRPEKIHIGYFSSDLHNHPVSQLIVGMLENHDRDNFEISAFYFGSVETDAMIERVKLAVDDFVNASQMDERAIAEMAREMGVDIAVDLNGYTSTSRSGAFAYKAAPIQINYLGYPSTMGAEFIDYILADSVLIPEEMQQYYSEKIIYMPNCYQPNDNKRVISGKNMARKDFGLPEDAFVFCCFNNNYKLMPTEFDIWMRVLKKVDGSVLWLLKTNEWTEKNLKREAENRGIDPKRIIFATRAPLDEHLARHCLADLFVDTFNYNAHTTASDALWAGLPLVTMAGKQFAARVAASLLKAANMPELITHTVDEYENLILELAEDHNRLAKLKSKLIENRDACPLFDTKLYTRHIENAYTQAFDTYLEGKPASSFKVKK